MGLRPLCRLALSSLNPYLKIWRDIFLLSLSSSRCFSFRVPFIWSSDGLSRQCAYSPGFYFVCSSFLFSSSLARKVGIPSNGLRPSESQWLLAKACEIEIRARSLAVVESCRRRVEPNQRSSSYSRPYPTVRSGNSSHIPRTATRLSISFLSVRIIALRRRRDRNGLI